MLPQHPEQIFAEHANICPAAELEPVPLASRLGTRPPNHRAVMCMAQYYCYRYQCVQNEFRPKQCAITTAENRKVLAKLLTPFTFMQGGCLLTSEFGCKKIGSRMNTLSPCYVNTDQTALVDLPETCSCEIVLFW